MGKSPGLIELYRSLAEKHVEPVTIRRLLDEAGITIIDLQVHTMTPIDTWYSVVDKIADDAEALRRLVKVHNANTAAQFDIALVLPADRQPADSTVSPAADLPMLAGVRPVPQFVERKAIMDQLDRKLAPRDNGDLPSAVLVGLGGIGKTQVAARYRVNMLNSRRYDHVEWLHAETRDKLERGLSALGRKLGVYADTDDSVDLARLTVERLETTALSWLLILDNVDSMSTIQGLLPSCGNGALLLTSRVKSLRSSFHMVEVTPLKAGECADHMLAVAESDDRAGALRLAEALGGLPLAMAHAAAYIHKTKIGFAEYLADLDRLPARDLLRSDPTEFYRETVASTWRRSVNAATAQTAEAATVLDRLSFLDPDNISRRLVDGPEAARVSGLDQTRLREAVGALYDYSLIGLTSTEVSIHRLVQKVTRDDAVESTRAEPAVGYLAQLIALLLQHLGESQQRWHDLVALRPHVLALLGLNKQTRASLGATAGAVDALVPIAVLEGLRAAAASPIDQVGQTSEAIKVLAGIERQNKTGPRPEPLLRLFDHLIEIGGSETDAKKALKSIVENENAEDVAAALLLTVENRHTLQLFLARHPRVDSLLKAHPSWAACVRFVCLSPSGDAALTALEAGVEAGDARSVHVWLGRLRDRRSGLSYAQVESKLRKFRHKHENIALALAGMLESKDSAAAIEVLEGAQHLGAKVPGRLARVLLDNGQRDAAIRVLRSFAATNPEAAIKLADLIKLDEPQYARSLLERFSAIDQEAALRLANLVQRQSGPEAAAQALNGLSRRWPGAAIRQAKLRLDAGDLVGAAAALKHHPNDPEVAKEIRNLISRTSQRDASYYRMLTELRAGRQNANPFAHNKAKKAGVTKPSTSLLIQVGDLVQRKAWWEAVTELVPDALSDEAAQRQEAIVSALRSLIVAKDGALAAALFGAFLSELPASQVLAMARQIAKLGVAPAVLELLEPLRETATTEVNIATALAAVEEEAGDRAAALATLGELRQPSVAVAMIRARLHEDDGAPELAVAALEPFLANPTAAARISKIASKSGRPQLALDAFRAVPEPSKAVTDHIHRLSRDADSVTDKADIEWFWGSADQAIATLMPHLDNPRAFNRVVEMMVSSGRGGEALEFLRQQVPRLHGHAMLLAEVASEHGGLAVAAPVLEPLVADSYQAALGLSWLAAREESPARARAYLEAHVKVRGRINRLVQIFSQSSESATKACTVAELLRQLGSFGYAEYTLRRYTKSINARLALADLLRVGLRFAESRELVEDLAPQWEKAALCLATNLLRNGRPSEAATVLSDFRGHNKYINRTAYWIGKVRTDGHAATRVARQMIDAGMVRCAFEVLQVTEDRKHPAVTEILQLPELSVAPEERNAVATVRTRALIHDRKLQIVVWPDFRQRLRAEFRKARFRTIAQASGLAHGHQAPASTQTPQAPPEPTPEPG